MGIRNTRATGWKRCSTISICADLALFAFLLLGGFCQHVPIFPVPTSEGGLEGGLISRGILLVVHFMSPNIPRGNIFVLGHRINK